MKVSTILSKKGGSIVSIRPEQTIREAVQLLARHRIGALVVLAENGRLAGILSERDIIWKTAETEAPLDLPVSEVMTQSVITGVPQDEVMSVAHLMTERRFRHLPILDGDRLIGIISIGDVLKMQRDHYRGEIDTLETQMLAEPVS
ncbi:MAG: CBS domain-containing protein [Ardenticatenaceae bacterium]|nr:CBS domain-containing protein [Ardenticatenaceae bacterium]